jgi:transcriptional regulator with XRE-family HTH domain
MAVPQVTDHQAQFAAAIAALLRQSRRRRGITQQAVAARTGGILTKGAIANYERGQRSMRIDVFWAIARALDEDPGKLLTAAERQTVGESNTCAASVTVDIGAVLHSADPRLDPVRRWFALRHASGAGRVSLDGGALAALAALMNLPPEACWRLLAAASSPRNRRTESN